TCRLHCPTTWTWTGPAIRSCAIPPGRTPHARHAAGRRGARALNRAFSAPRPIALTVSQHLHAHSPPTAKLHTARPRTANLTAFEFYTRAKNLALMTSFTIGTKANLEHAADLLNQAVSHDSSFFQAYCLLAHTHDLLYFFGFDRTPARLTLAESAIEAAFRLRPDSGEAHLASAEKLYRGYLDYDRAF